MLLFHNKPYTLPFARMTDEEIYGFGSYSVTEISHYTLSLSDGTKLSAKLWIPDFRRDSTKSFSKQFAEFNFNTFDVHLIGKDNQTDKIVDPEEKFPVILEYLPYYKDIGTATRDHNRHPWFSSHGFVVMRVEMRGTGASGGFYHGEYLPQEQEDCKEVLQFVVQQQWSNGRVGMYGKSWGGFNGLQMAYLEPEDSPLKTAISLYSTDNRYTGDFHHEGGIPVGLGLLSWAAFMLVNNIRPPPPRCFSKREDWLEAWTQRLKDNSNSFLASWTHNQLPGPFWDHGSIYVNYDKVTIPIFVIGGLEDAYKTPAERMARNLNDKSKMLIGPWVHDWPDVSLTGPNIEYLEMCLNWFSAHLKDTDIDAENSCSKWPRLHLYVRDSFKPTQLFTSNGEEKEEATGRFVAFNDWVETGNSVEEAMKNIIELGETTDNDKNINTLFFERNFLNENKLSFKPYTSNLKTTPVQLYSHALQGVNCGAWFHSGVETGYPGDQATSISNSVSFMSDPIVEPIVMVGLSTCLVRISSSSWKRVYISVKVSDLHSDGTATLVTRCQYDLNYIKPVRSDEKSKTFVLPMQLVSHCFQPHNKIVISVSPNAFPMMWPSNVPADMHIFPEDCRFIYQTETVETINENTVNFPKPRPLLPLAKVQLSPPSSNYLVTKIGDKFNFVYQEDSGLEHILHTSNVKHQQKTRATYVTDEEVTEAKATLDQEHTIVFDSLGFVDDGECNELGVKITTHQSFTGDEGSYRIEEELTVSWSGTEEIIFTKNSSEVIPRLDHNSWT